MSGASNPRDAGRATPGLVSLVGAGPGDRDLVTVKALRLVMTAQAIVHDRLGTGSLLDDAPPGCILIDAGKAPGRCVLSQEAINRRLIDIARTGRPVVRLKGGDPFILGRGGEEALALAEAGIPFEVVPGISSALAAAAQELVPLTHREISRTVTIASGHDDPRSPAAADRWARLARVPGTLVLLMAMARLDGIAAALIAGGRHSDEPAAAVHAAGTAQTRTVVASLATIAAACRDSALGAPAVVVVGPVVAIRESLHALAADASGARFSVR